MEPSWPQVGQFTSFFFFSFFVFFFQAQFHASSSLRLLGCYFHAQRWPSLSLLYWYYHIISLPILFYLLAIANGSQDGISRPRDVVEITRLFGARNFHEFGLHFRFPQVNFCCSPFDHRASVNCRLEFNDLPTD